jgi:hypothetical protein
VGQWVRLVCVVPGELVDAWEHAKTRATREGAVRWSAPEQVQNGQVLEVLIAEYLASPEMPADFRRESE